MIVYTPSVHETMQFSLFEKSNSLHFDEIYIKKYYHSWYKISIIEFDIGYIFIINLFRDININTIYYKFG
jgi:hypothetical protein